MRDILKYLLSILYASTNVTETLMGPNDGKDLSVLMVAQPRTARILRMLAHFVLRIIV